MRTAASSASSPPNKDQPQDNKQSLPPHSGGLLLYINRNIYFVVPKNIRNFAASLKDIKRAYAAATKERTRQMSPVFKRERGYTFRIFSNEEERKHIHVMKDDCEAKIWLEPEVELDENDGFAKHEISQIIKIVQQYADDFRNQYQRHIGKRIDDK